MGDENDGAGGGRFLDYQVPDKWQRRITTKGTLITVGIPLLLFATVVVTLGAGLGWHGVFYAPTRDRPGELGMSLFMLAVGFTVGGFALRWLRVAFRK